MLLGMIWSPLGITFCVYIRFIARTTLNLFKMNPRNESIFVSYLLLVEEWGFFETYSKFNKLSMCTLNLIVYTFFV